MSEDHDSLADTSPGAPQDGAPDDSLYHELQALIEDGRTFAEAEFAYQKSRATYAAARGKAIAGFGALALVLVVFALFALLVGSILGLTPLVGAWAAMAIVVAALLLATAVCLAVVRHNIRRLKQAFAEEEPE